MLPLASRFARPPVGMTVPSGRSGSPAGADIRAASTGRGSQVEVVVDELAKHVKPGATRRVVVSACGPDEITLKPSAIRSRRYAIRGAGGEVLRSQAISEEPGVASSAGLTRSFCAPPIGRSLMPDNRPSGPGARRKGSIVAQPCRSASCWMIGSAHHWDAVGQLAIMR